jgi:hypothetical protein
MRGLGMLSPQQQQLWESYQRVESRGCREEKVSALEAFVAAVRSTPRQQWRDWALALAERVADKRADIPIRMPLFRHVLFPALLEGFLARRPGCARWLSEFTIHLARCPDCLDQLPPEDRGEGPLLRAALRHDPQDRASRRRLIKCLAEDFDYTLHEVPAGVVLDRMDGEGPQKCVQLQNELQEFCDLVAQEQIGASYRNLIEECQYHFYAYEDYLRHRDQYQDYDQYMRRHPPRA